MLVSETGLQLQQLQKGVMQIHLLLVLYIGSPVQLYMPGSMHAYICAVATASFNSKAAVWAVKLQST